MFDSILPDKPKLNKLRLEIYFYSFLGVHQNFEVIACLNYRFIKNLHVFVCFQHIKPVIAQLFSLVHISFSKNPVYLAYTEF